MQAASVFVRKLELFAPLSAEDRALLEQHSQTVRTYDAKVDIIREGDATDHVHLIVSGFACRYKLTEDGKRQIIAFLLPGDLCDVHIFILKSMDHSIGTLSPCQVAHISRSAILELSERPAIARALWWATLVDEATLREWIVNIGQRPAEERLAHFLCEIALRMHVIGLSQAGRCAFPVTQNDLADVLGITYVHVNRMLMNLRDRHLIEVHSRELIVLDAKRLQEFSGFNSNYLHLTGGKSDNPATH